MRLPDTRNASDAELEAFVRATCGTDYHPSGTAKMGSGSDAVVDADLRVYGVDGLRVVDASVLPTLVSGQLNATVTAVAEKAAAMMLEEHASRRAPAAPSSPHRTGHAKAE